MTLRLGWLLVCLYKEAIYKFLNVCPYDYTAVAGSGKVGPVNQVNHTSWMDIVTPTDRPKSVRNRSVIELFVALFVLSFCPFDISVGVGAFVIGLSQISSLFSVSTEYNTTCQEKVQKGGFETISHDFRNIFDKWLSHGVKKSIKIIHLH